MSVVNFSELIASPGQSINTGGGTKAPKEAYIRQRAITVGVGLCSESGVTSVWVSRPPFELLRLSAGDLNVVLDSPLLVII